MKELRFLIITFALIAAISFLGVKCYPGAASSDPREELSVVTSFYPMYVTAMSLTDGTDGISVSNLSDPQTGCLHDYVLSTKDMKLLSDADAFVVNGGGIEGFLDDIRAEYPDLVIIDSSSLITDEDRDGIYSDADEPNVHYWMSIPLYQKQIEAISEGLCSLSAKNDADVSQIRHNTKDYLHSLEKLALRQQKLSEKLSGSRAVILHGAYAYAAKDYGINVSYVMDLDEEDAASAGEVSEMMDIINNEDITLTLAEELYGQRIGDLILKNTASQVVWLDTITRSSDLGTVDIKDQYLERMEANIRLLEQYIYDRDYS